MTFEEIQRKVARWAADRELLLPHKWMGADRQFLKLEEEVEELSAAIHEQDLSEAIDAIGDCLVVLTNIALNLGTTPQACYEHAWHQIKDRTGKTVGGVFVKDAP